jgi:protein-tyrosine phosphatase
MKSTTTRVVELSGGLNFRDLGGYPTADGRSVRWSRLYRSGTTHFMTPEDVTHLSERGIRYVYDLRSSSERRLQPSALHGLPELAYRFPEHDRPPGDIVRLLKSGKIEPEQARQTMFQLYRQLPYEFRDCYRELFGHLAEGDLPLVFNCAAGKDRTGVAAALVLSALGVQHDAIVEDYTLTEHCFDRSCELLLNERNGNLFAGLEVASWEPLMRADPVYLQAMFEHLRAEHGSVGRYLEEELGVTPARREHLRSQLLE